MATRDIQPGGFTASGPIASGGPIAREVSQALLVFSRAARARHLYRANHTVLTRMMKDLENAFFSLFSSIPDLTLKVRPEAFLFEGERVFEEANPDASIPFAFYRDGIRRLDFERGLSRDELEILVLATANGFAYTGLGDDIVSFLWRHDLEHVRYVVVDTTIVDAARGEGGPGGAPSEFDLGSQIDGLLMSIYGTTSEDVGVRSIHVDSTDIPAKSIADSLSKIDEMAPGFHPARAMLKPPRYAAELLREVESETDGMLTGRVLRSAIHALASPAFLAHDASILTETLLHLYDAALVSGDVGQASWLLSGMRSLQSFDHFHQRASDWLDQACSDARLRPGISALSGVPTSEGIRSIETLIRAAGPVAVPALLGAIPSVQDPVLRRTLSDLALEVGTPSVAPIEMLLRSEQVFVALEAIYILGRMGSEEARALLLDAERHPQAPVRIALLEATKWLPRKTACVVAERLLCDADPRVSVTAARLIASFHDRSSELAVHAAVQHAGFEDLAYSVKVALLEAHAALSSTRALGFLVRKVGKTEENFVHQKTEDSAVAATQALGLIQTPGAIAALKKAAVSSNKRVRDTARGILQSKKGGP